MNEGSTISLEDFSTIMTIPEARATYNFTLPAEPEGNTLAYSDYQVFLIPTVESEHAVVASDTSLDNKYLDVTVLEVKKTYDCIDKASTPDESAVDQTVNAISTAKSDEKTDPAETTHTHLNDTVPAMPVAVEETNPAETAHTVHTFE